MKWIQLMMGIGLMACASVNGFAGDLNLIKHGSWVSSTIPPSQQWYEDISVWMDIKVPNWSYHKTVGVVWTPDAWKTVKFSYARYEYTRSDGYEQWGVDIIPAGVLGNTYIGPASWNGVSLLGGAEVEYAIFTPCPWLYLGTTIRNYHILIATQRSAFISSDKTPANWRAFLCGAKNALGHLTLLCSV